MYYRILKGGNVKACHGVEYVGGVELFDGHVEGVCYVVFGVLEETLEDCANDTTNGDAEENIRVDRAFLDRSLNLYQVEQRDRTERGGSYQLKKLSRIPERNVNRWTCVESATDQRETAGTRAAATSTAR